MGGRATLASDAALAARSEADMDCWVANWQRGQVASWEHRVVKLDDQADEAAVD